MCCNGKCMGFGMIVAAVLFGLAAYETFAWLNLAMVFGILALGGAIHAFFCKKCEEVCETPKAVKKKK